MKTGPQPENQKSIHPRAAITLIVIAAILVFAIGYAVFSSKPDNSQSNAPAAWATFQSAKYGFKFTYPPSWGKPQVAVTAGHTGSHYQIGFSGGVVKKQTVTISMDSTDYTPGYCTSACSPPLTGDVISSHLKSGASGLLKHDSSSYAFLAVDPSASVSTLTDTQVVSLPKIKVTGALGIYSLTGGKKCAPGKFSDTSQAGCIHSAEYNNLNSVMKSIKQV